MAGYMSVSHAFWYYCGYEDAYPKHTISSENKEKLAIVEMIYRQDPVGFDPLKSNSPTWAWFLADPLIELILE